MRFLTGVAGALVVPDRAFAARAIPAFSLFALLALVLAQFFGGEERRVPGWPRAVAGAVPTVAFKTAATSGVPPKGDTAFEISGNEVPGLDGKWGVTFFEGDEAAGTWRVPPVPGAPWWGHQGRPALNGGSRSGACTRSFRCWEEPVTP